MSINEETHPVRRGRSEKKRAAILTAAEELFLVDGYDRTSADAIALRAGVSKRTVYDHFGNKEGLYGAVVRQATSGLLETVVMAAKEELPEGCDPASSLLAFVRRVATEAFGSSQYALFRRLLAAAGPAMALTDSDDPATILMDRIKGFHRAGTLDAPDASRATDHLVALTFLLALDSLERTPGGDAVDAILVDGVAAFMRAYAPRRESSPNYAGGLR